MSVINKMLRDLDSRNAAGTRPVQDQASRPGVARGTLSVNDSDRGDRQRGSPKRGVWTVVAVMVLVVAGAMSWVLKPLPSVQAPVVPSEPPSVAQPVATPAVAPVAAVATTPKALQALRVASAPVTPTLLAVKLPEPTLLSRHAGSSLRMDESLKNVTGAVKESRLGASAAVPPERPVTELAQKSALNVLAQAQNLWRSGSHVPAVELLREALAVAERSAKPSGNNSELASLTRELARMELAEGRTGQALAMLTRLEPLLSGFADIWAIRGNAAQRLGRHEESAAAYLMALELRPDEPRWMLGAAVSLAAHGKTTSAAEFAEKARAAGVLSPDVATYLRQLGVPVREP